MKTKKDESKIKKPRKKRSIPEIVYDLTHARHDPGHCHASLFRSLQKGTRTKQGMDITYKFGKESLRFVCYNLLGVEEMIFLQVFVALAGKDKRYIKLDGSAKTELGRSLAKLLDPQDDAIFMKSLIIKNETFYRILKESGYDPHKSENIERLKESMFRLANVTLRVTSKERIFATTLLSYSINVETNLVSIALNPLVTESIFGQRSYTRIDLSEVRSLKTDPARILHERLCAWVWPGETKKVHIDKLTAYIWPDKATESTMRKRRERARKALQEICSIGWKGWSVEESKKGICSISRTKVVNSNDEEDSDNKEEDS
jgi:hypothetical protein